MSPPTAAGGRAACCRRRNVNAACHPLPIVCRTSPHLPDAATSSTAQDGRCGGGGEGKGRVVRGEHLQHSQRLRGQDRYISCRCHTVQQSHCAFGAIFAARVLLVAAARMTVSCHGTRRRYDQGFGWRTRRYGLWGSPTSDRSIIVDWMGRVATGTRNTIHFCFSVSFVRSKGYRS